MIKRADTKILLLQLREDEATMREEHESFAKFSELKLSQIEVLNVFQIPEFTPDFVNDYHGMFIGGSSSATVLQPEKYTFIRPCVNLIHYCIRESLPVFASCFGHQLVAVALGAKVHRDNGENFEKGTLPIQLTPKAEDDILFHDMPDEFLAVSVHREYTTEVPQGCNLIGFTDVCTHSFKVKNKPFWTSQFHPEVDKEILLKRLSLYWTQYFDSKEELQSFFDNTKETPEANDLLKKFIDRVVIGANKSL